MTTTPAWDDLTPVVEGRALKLKLQGMTVTGSNYADKTLTVPVHLVSPDFEIQNAEYPGVYITYNGLSKASEREHRGPTNLTYAPAGIPAEPEMFDRNTSRFYVPEFPIPYNVDFNVAVMTRSQQHAFELITELQKVDRLPERFGGLEVPEDGTVRTLELTGGPTIQVGNDEDSKRMVTTLYSVRVAAELNMYDVEMAHKVTAVNIDLTTKYL